jgi:hypothetical protein
MPLDLGDEEPRIVVADFGPGGPQAAEYSVDGDVAEIFLSAESHQEIRPHFLEPIPEYFTPLVLHVDRTDGSATSEFAGGAYQGGNLSESFWQNPLSTEVTYGFMTGNNLSPLFCVSQAQVDDACINVNTIFCGVVCNLVPGSAYDPMTGELRLVGYESREGCDGWGSCFGPFLYFSSLEPTLSELVPTFNGDEFDWSLSRGSPPVLDSGTEFVIDPGLEDEVLGEEVLGSFDVGPDTLLLTIILEDGHGLASQLHWSFSNLHPFDAPDGVVITGLIPVGGTGTVIDASFGPDSLSIVTAQEQAPPNVFTYEFEIEMSYVPEPDGTLLCVVAVLSLWLRGRTSSARSTTRSSAVSAARSV